MSIVKPIKITDKDTGNTYTLEYTRRTVVAVNDLGFDRTAIMSNPEKMIPLLWHGAFLANHRRIKQDETDAILAKINGITPTIIERLVELYNQPLAALVRDDTDEEDEKNATVTVEL